MAQNLTWMRWLKVLSFYRMVNLVLLGLSYCISRWFKKSFHYGLPYHVSFEPTTACNLGCPECPSGLKQFTRATGKLSLEHHERWLKSMAPHLIYVTYYFQGEPFLHPQFLALVSEAKKYRLFTATSTNAHFIDERNAAAVVQSGLDQLIISVDGVTQEVYEQYRVQGNLEKVWTATKALVEAKKRLKSSTPQLIFQCLAVKPNEAQIPDIFLKAKEFGVDEVRIKSAQLYDFENGHPLMPDNDDYRRYRLGKNGKFSLKNPGGNRCWRMWTGCVITWDGKIVPCCFDKDALHSLGSLQAEDFKEVWSSDSYRQFRNSILTNRSQIDICQNCSEGSKVWL
jgi:radical SAM protein with 4Fe4S-binding SPASM domain